MEIVTSILLVVVVILVLLGAVFYFMKQNGARVQATLLKETSTLLQQTQARQREELIATTQLIGENAFKNIAGRIDEMKQHQKETSETRERSLTQLSANLHQNISSLSQTVHKQLGETIEKLGEFKELSKGVDNLSKVLSNVKQKGKFGEYQLESIIVDLVPNAYYHKEYTMSTGTSRGVKVDFVIRLPGKRDEITWLPIDSKYPHEPYERLLAVREALDGEGEKRARKELVKFFKEAAQSIKKKYIVPPETTDFAILFVPHESIFLELYRDNHFVDMLRQEYSVILTGPNHFYALLHMLQMGYTKMAIEKRSQVLWEQLTVLQDGMRSLTEVLMKTGRKAEILYEDIHGVHRRADKLTKNLTMLQNPADTLAEDKQSFIAGDGGERTEKGEAILDIHKAQAGSSTGMKEERFLSEGEALEHYREPLQGDREESAQDSLFE